MISDITIFEGAVVKLRPLMMDDLATTILWRNDPALKERVLGYRFPVTVPMEQNWYERNLRQSSPDSAYFGIEKIGQSSLVGMVSLTDIDWISRHAVLGIVIGRAADQGNGCGKDAVSLILSYAFNSLNLSRIWLKVAVYNKAAIRLFEKLGFKSEGILRNHVYVNGKYHDIKIMGALASEFLASE